MSAERWRQIRRLLEEARELPATERAGYLTEACGDDDGLRAEVESLIAHGEASGDLVNRSPAESTLAEPAPSPPVERVGPYRVEREIGRGGMGAVFLAIRDDEEFKRRVALKLLHPGMVSDDIVRRFRNERQILAGIDHPHVAKLYDGGTTDGGLPYLAMEYIEGTRIDEYCDAHKLSIEKRLTLFRKVCSAVHFAHQNLVIHRDLKPANILVTAEGEPKLLDFGIAKLLNPELAASTLGTTQADARLLTPEYASPEQIKGEPITTASDVYALGVLLYRLLTGHSPYRLPGLQLHQIARAICETEPTRPSAVIDEIEEVTGAAGTTQITAATVAETREASPDRLRRKLKGDLDNVVLMALRKEPSRRYSSVEQFSEDVRRSLGGLPVRARRGTLAYRSSKFVRRHRAVLAVAAAVVLSLVGFTAFTVSARARAESEAAKSKAVVEFLREALGSANPMEGRDREVTVVEVLGKAVESIDASFVGQPELQAVLRRTIGETYQGLGQYEEAERLLRSALATRRALLGEPHPDVAESLNDLGALLVIKGEYDAAEALFREALTMRRVLSESDTDLAESLNNLGVALHRKGDYEEADPLYREALALRRRVLGDNHKDVADTLNYLAQLMFDKGQLGPAEELYREALAIRRRVHGPNHPAVAQGLNNLATVLNDRGDLDAAEPLYREALDIWRQSVGNEHPDVAATLGNLATLLLDKKSYEAAEPLLREALALDRKMLGAEHPYVAWDMQNLGRLLSKMGRYQEAEALHRTGLAMTRKTLGNEHRQTATLVLGLADLLRDTGDYEGAEPLYLEAIQVFQRSAPDTWLAANARCSYGALLTQVGRFEEAEDHLLNAYEQLRSELGDEHDRTHSALSRVLELYAAWGKPEEVDAYQRRVTKSP